MKGSLLSQSFSPALPLSLDFSLDSYPAKHAQSGSGPLRQKDEWDSDEEVSQAFGGSQHLRHGQSLPPARKAGARFVLCVRGRREGSVCGTTSTRMSSSSVRMCVCA
ncbi:unnamed protein product [Leuciscus chuanchicus]